MIKQTTTLLTTLIVLISSCHNLDYSLLHGNWQAVQLVENGDTIDIDLSTTKLSFDNNRQYSYQTSVNYKEAGTYVLSANTLITKDTVDKNAIDKSVLITFLSQDTIKLKMNASGKTQILTLTKTR